MTDHYFKAERLLEMAGTHTNTGDERDAALAALFAARAQVHATLALATRHTEQAETPELTHNETLAPAPEPEAVPLCDAYATWGDCVVRDRRGDLAQVADGRHTWIAASGPVAVNPEVNGTSAFREAPVTLVTRLAPWPEPGPEPKILPLNEAYATWGDCVVRDRHADLASVADGCHIWLTAFGAPTRAPHVCTTGHHREEPVTLVTRLAPWPVMELESVPLWRAAETWGDDIEVQSLDNPTVRWRVRGGKYLITGGNKWWTLTKASKAMVTLASREPYRDDPWAPGQDVTDRLAAGETAPAGTILRDCEGDLYRVTQSGSGAAWSPSTRLWYHTGGLWSWGSVGDNFSWANYAPIHVATPEQVRAAGIEVTP